MKKQKDLFNNDKEERCLDLKRQIYEELQKPFREACLRFVNLRNESSFRSEEEDLQTRIQNLYLYFDQENFLSEISQVIDELEVNKVFESSLKDNDGKIVKFVLVENFSSKDGNNCKKVKFNEPLRLSNIDEGTEVTLDLCKVNENYELSSINISK